MASEPTLSIGALAQACGVPASTLRTWERRYGVPAPQRSSGGQRVYAAADIGHLKLVSEALSRGHRAGQVVPAGTAELRRLLGIAERSPIGVVGSSATLLAAVGALDGEALERQLRSDWGRHDALSFLDRVAAPFLRDMGDAWSEGRLSVAQEHFGSERLRGFLEETWRPLASIARGPRLVLAGLPGERHVLGLHMVAVLAVLSGYKPIFLGADVPLEDLVACAERCGAHAVLVSVAAGSADPAVALSKLRALLLPGIELVAGGAGAPEGVPGVQVRRRLAELQVWLDSGAA
jgi:MerR family transcriptional regulator, light-induced transcriptional regulator